MSDTGKIVSLVKALGGGSGGGSGLPTGGAPHQMLVTDAEGNAQWEDKLCYETWEDVVCLPETTLTVNEDAGGFIVPAFVTTPVAGGIYTVNWLGTEYTCTGKTITDNGITAVTLGSAEVIGGEYTDDPFLIMCLPDELVAEAGVAAQILPLDGGKTSITISISGKQPAIKKIDPKFIESEEETVYIDMDSTYPWENVSVAAPYTMVKSLVESGVNVVARLSCVVEETLWQSYLRLAAKNTEGISFFGESYLGAVRGCFTVTMYADDKNEISIGRDDIVLTSSNGTKWIVSVDDSGNLITSMG